ncbi:hypothetical protein O6H91_09G005500 [Diphasiastrum complanatum]|uniref:Uncharacterized protein n=1 Tax=Diphasiastrum complanatum TaxID=34168 RepID=A0ACC2CKY4_DIPCM|nr:hypothetical protein O6H91_09G005500 [Diphasiastrum complanatum]
MALFIPSLGSHPNKRLLNKKESTVGVQQHKEIIVLSGQSSPLGPSCLNDAVNFALFSKHATSVSLCLFWEYGNTGGRVEEIILDPQVNKTKNIGMFVLRICHYKGCFMAIGLTAHKGGRRVIDLIKLLSSLIHTQSL